MKHAVALVLSLLMLLGAACAEPITLLISGNYLPMEKEFNAFRKAHPNIKIERAGVETTEQLIQDALLRDDVTDVYFLNPVRNRVYNGLRDRGFLAPIEDAELLSLAESLYPGIRRGLEHNNQICAIPYDSMVQPMVSVNMDDWTSLGFSEADLPKSWAEFLQFLLDEWPALAEEHPEISCLNLPDAADWVMILVQGRYFYAQQSREELRYDTDCFREIVRLIGQIDWSICYNVNGNPLFDLNYIASASTRDYYGSYRYLPLAFEENDPIYVPISTPVIAINPNSRHKEAAYELIRYFVDRLEPMRKVELYENWSEPIPSPDFESFMEMATEYLAELDRKIAADEDPAQTKLLVNDRDSYAQYVQNYAETRQYDANAESIAAFRETIARNYVFAYDLTISNEEYEIVENKRRQFLQGDIDADAYVDEIQRRYALELREG